MRRLSEGKYAIVYFCLNNPTKFLLLVRWILVYKELLWPCLVILSCSRNLLLCMFFFLLTWKENEAN